MKKGPAKFCRAFLISASLRELCDSALALALFLLRSRASPAGASYTAAAGRFFLLLFLARLADQRLTRQPDLVALNRKHLDQHLVAQLQLIADVANAMLRNLADVQQAVGAREKFDERAKLGQPHDLAEIRLADLRRSGDFAHHLQRRISSRAAGGENVH